MIKLLRSLKNLYYVDKSCLKVGATFDFLHDILTLFFLTRYWKLIEHKLLLPRIKSLNNNNRLYLIKILNLSLSFLFFNQNLAFLSLYKNDQFHPRIFDLG